MEFKETQKPARKKRTYLTYVSFLIIPGLFVYASLRQDTVLFLVAVSMLITRGTLECLFYFAKFQTIVNEEGVFFRGSFNKAVAFNWSLVDKAEIVKVGLVGYGTGSRSLRTVYNVAGDTGLGLILKSGKKVVIGTQKPEELTTFLTAIDRLH